MSSCIWRLTYLDLVDGRWPDLANLLDLLDMPNAIVADANLARLPFFLRLLQCEPHQLPLLGPSIGAVDQEKIHVSILASQLLDAIQNALVCRVHVVTGAEDFGRQVDFLALEPRLSQCLSNLLLVCIVLRRVDVSVASLQRCETGFDACLGGRLVDTEAELGDLVRGVRERERGVQAKTSHCGSILSDSRVTMIHASECWVTDSKT